MLRFHLLAGLLAAVLPAAAPPAPFTYTPAVERALDRISAGSLRGNLSFLASDLLEGRDTPSRGLEIAGEFLAAEFRKIGLQPAGSDGYFQEAGLLRHEPRPESFELTIETAAGPVTVREAAVQPGSAAADIRHAGVARVVLDGSAPLPAPEAVAGKVVFARWPGSGGSRRVQALRAMAPALIVTLGGPDPAPRLVEPGTVAPAWVTLRDDALEAALERAPAEASVSAALRPSAGTRVKLRNVIGLLPGEDPALAGTYVLVTAHYDHIGVAAHCSGDCIFNGANDNGSGSVSLAEIARALAALERRPRRSVVFLALFGEERGLLGARWYVRHPVFPLAATVANLNLEELGRTDAGDAQVGTATFTGFRLSDLPLTFQQAGALTGIRVYDSPASDTYFRQSDNVVFAAAGIPAHTASVAYTYPDYHGPADTWDKIDYDNMARVNRMLALGVLMLAESDVAPRWNESNPRAAEYMRQRKSARPAAQ